VRSIHELGPDAARERMPGLIARQRTSPEGQEGLTAFLEKRPPAWKA
jgi:methylglutaconyl-CoA hydratase